MEAKTNYSSSLAELMNDSRTKESLQSLLSPEDFKTAPILQRSRELLDQVWNESCRLNGIHPTKGPFTEEFLSNYYNHPVWAFQGVYQEFQEDFIAFRKRICELVEKLPGENVFDYGGGFGQLVRQLAVHLPERKIFLYDVGSFDLMKTWFSEIKNAFISPQLKNDIDILISTDVLEHVLDPLQHLKTYHGALKRGGHLVLHWDFLPTIACHLRQHFWLHGFFQEIVAAAGFKKVFYDYQNDIYIYRKDSDVFMLNRFKWAAIKYARKLMKWLPHPIQILFRIVAS